MELLILNDEGVIEETKNVVIDRIVVGENTIQCIVDAQLVPDDGGTYRIKVSHSYNGSIYSKETNNFNINIS